MEDIDPMAQDAIRCDLCVKGVDVHCKSCSVNLCDGCVGKHIGRQGSKIHDIVSYRYRNEILKGLVPPSCTRHSGKKCDEYCTQCRVPFCSQCLASGMHKRHEATDINAFMTSKKETLERETKDLEHVLRPKYASILSDLQTKLDALPKEYSDKKIAATTQGTEWHKQVDIVVKMFLAELDKMEQRDKSFLQDALSEITKLLSIIQKTVKDNKETLKLNDGNVLVDYTSRYEEICDVPPHELTPSGFIPKKIEVEQLQRQFGLLESSLHEAKQLLNKVEKTIEIATGYQKALSVCCVDGEQVWVSGFDKVIKRIDKKGTVLDKFTTKHGVQSIAVTNAGEVIYNDPGERSINLMRNGKSKMLFKLNEWRPLGICSTISGDIIVCMQSDDKFARTEHDWRESKVVRYSGSTVTQDIQYDESGNRLFMSGTQVMQVCENGNEDLCVGDANAKVVIVLDHSGKLRFRYNNNHSPKKYRTFTPIHVATDRMFHILITDSANNCIHVVDQVGQFLCYIDSCGLQFPVALSIDSADNMWVTERDTAKIKVLKYLK